MASKSSTSVGAGRAPSKAVAKSSSGGGLRQRKPASGATRSKVGAPSASSGLMRFYTEDSPGIKVGPVPVLVMSILFIACVFLLHIWGKYSR
eukprot:m.306586 g.306586  ORF g.306586 m.306586 type:complete len:92 (+) comp41373_c0_seq1:70-345(+)